MVNLLLHINLHLGKLWIFSAIFLKTLNVVLMDTISVRDHGLTSDYVYAVNKITNISSQLGIVPLMSSPVSII